MANTTGIKIDTLMQVQNTIMNGITEVNETMKASSEQRKQDSAELTKMVSEMKQKGFEDKSWQLNWISIRKFSLI